MMTSNYWFGQAGGYEINQSLRFNSADSATLTRTPASASNQKTYTFSFWHKGTARYDDKKLFVVGATSVTSGFVELSATGSGSGGKAGIRHSGNSLITSAIYRDPSAWAHYVFAFDSTQATDTNRLKLYVNGEQVTITGTWFAQDAVSRVNSTDIHTIGVGRSFSGTNDGFLDAYLAEFNFIDGTALTPSSFGETDTITGAWIPKKYSGSYGTNGFYLKFDPSATNGIGHDHSGNGNNFTATGFSTSGTGTDVMSDTPTNNYATLNPAIRPYPSSTDVITDGNLVFSSSNASVSGSAWATTLLTTGKWYYEATLTTAGPSNNCVGFSNNTIAAGAGTYTADARTYGWFYQSSGEKTISATTTSYGASYTTGDVIGVALDIDAATITFYKNNTSQGQLTGLSLASGSSGWLAAVEGFNGTVWNVNFGQRAFAYTPPTGYKALNTANLPEPTIKDGSANFNTVLYTGNGTSQSLSAGFASDLVWVKNRSTANSHQLTDSVRGNTNALASDLTIAEYTGEISLTGSGFSVTGNANATNKSAETYVGWNWKESATAGFDIVTYTGNGAASQVVNHSLGVTPNFVIVKNRSNTASWNVWGSQGFTRLGLNIDNGDLGNFGITRGASSITLPSTSDVGWNALNENYVAYLWSEVASFSKFGSYTGNGSSDGVFIHLGFKPAFFMWKVTSTTGSWGILDFKRDTYNVSGKQLFPNQSDAEASYTVCDLLSNGIKMRNTFGDTNGSGSTYIFAAFAEHPFKYANAR